MLELYFESEVIYWRGPSPFYFARVPEEEARAIQEISKSVTYGWGVIPSDVKIDSVEFYTALFPKDGSYLVPLKKSVREAADIDIDSTIKVTLYLRS